MKRIKEVIKSLHSRGVDGILISDLKNIRYLTGFTGSSAAILISKREKSFCTDPRYKEQAEKEVTNFDIYINEEDVLRTMVVRARSSKIKTLGFESTLSYESYRKLLRKGFKVKAVFNLVEDLRKIKDKSELKCITEAVKRAERAFRSVKPYIRRGVTEKQIAGILGDNLKTEGCSELPFDIIVASGRNSSMPHARPTNKKIKAGNFVVIDWGGTAGGYSSDMTRTLLINGKNLSRKKMIFETVLQANREAIKAVRGGGLTRTVDKAARDIIKKAGYGDFFGHGTGHGVGLDVHELPRISRFCGDNIKAGMIFTVEPGIYVPGIGGVRIEDMVLAQESGCRVLTTLSKNLEVVC
jgi:Xaa-Pro aminopeptidase